jgi:predicted ATPase
VIFSFEEQEAIKKGYLKWKKPTEIALFLELRPIDVHNFIQGKHIEWQDEDTYCAICNEDLIKHTKCSMCESIVHDEEQIKAGRAQDWYKMYHIFGEDVVCNWCVASMGRKFWKQSHI